MYCKHCGKEVAEDAKFCSYCGGFQGHKSNVSNQVISFIKKHKLIAYPYLFWFLLNTFLLYLGNLTGYGETYWFGFSDLWDAFLQTISGDSVLESYSYYGTPSEFYNSYGFYKYDKSEFVYYVFLLPLTLFFPYIAYKALKHKVMSYLEKKGVIKRIKDITRKNNDII